MSRGKGKDKYKDLYGMDLVRAASDEDGNITSDVNYILLMGRTSSNNVYKEPNRVHMNEYSIPKLRH